MSSPPLLVSMNSIMVMKRNEDSDPRELEGVGPAGKSASLSVSVTVETTRVVAGELFDAGPEGAAGGVREAAALMGEAAVVGTDMVNDGCGGK